MFLPLEFYTFSSAVNFLTTASLGTFVLLTNFHLKTNRLFVYFCYCVAFWSLFYVFWLQTQTAAMAEYYLRTCMFSIFLLPGLFLHFTYHFLEKKVNKAAVVPNYIIGILLFFVVYSPHFASSPEPFLVFTFWLKGGPFLTFSIIHLVSIVAFSSFLLHLEMNQATGTRRTQIQFVYYGLLVSFAAGMTNYFAWYRIPIPPALNIFSSLFSLVIFYAIFKHHLLDIRIIVKKSLVYSVLVSLLSVIFLTGIYITENIFKNLVGYQSAVISIFSAVIIAILFIPLRNLLHRLIDRLFFRKTPFEMEKENTLLRGEAAQKEKFKAVAALASGIAHEIKNPLTALKAFYEYFPDKKDDPEFMRKFNHIATKEFDRMEELVKQLLDFAKPSTPCYELTNITQLVDDTLSLIHTTMERNKIILNRGQKDAHVNLNLDPNQLKQALLNIFLNAIEAMPDGGVLTVNSHLNGRGYCVEVQDTGSGISKEALAHIFEPFYSEKKSGTGLGMAITKNIIDKHRGRISVCRLPEGGTKFLLKFPGAKK